MADMRLEMEAVMFQYRTGDGRQFYTLEEAIAHANFVALVSRIFIAVEKIGGCDES